MSTFTLAISCLTNSNFPWFMELTFQGPMQYCYLQHLTLLSPPDTSTAERHFQFDSLFIPFGVISPWFSSSILGTYWPGEFIFQCHIFLPFYTVPNLTLEDGGTCLQNLHKTGETDPWRAQKTLCAPGPRRKEQWSHSLDIFLSPFGTSLLFYVQF